MSLVRFATVLGLFALTACSTTTTTRAFREPGAGAVPLGAGGREPELSVPVERAAYEPPVLERAEPPFREPAPVRVDFDCWRCGGR